MSLIDKAGIAVIFIGGGLVYLAEEYKLSFLIPIALAGFGLFAVWLGVDTFVQGRIQLLDRLYSRREYYSGAMARLLAIIIFLFGAGVTLYAAWEWFQPGVAGATMARLVNSARGWGIILSVSGFFMALFGILRVVAGSAWKKEERNGLVDFGFRMRGLIGMIIGLLLCLGGFWLVVRS